VIMTNGDNDMKSTLKYWRRVRLLAVAVAAVAGGVVATPGPALADSATGQFHLFSISPGGGLFQDTYSSGWTGWQSLGNDSEALTGTPGIAYDPDNGTYHAFAVGKTSGNVYQDTYTPSSGWGDWQNLGGVVQGGVSAVYEGGTFHVFSISPGGGLFQDTYSSGWTGWLSLGNDGEALTGTPGIAYDPDNGSFHAFAVGKTSGNVYQDTYTPSSGWGDWQNLGGVLQGGVSAVYENSTYHIFSISPGGGLFQNTYSSGWTGWQSLGNDSETLTGSPGIAYEPDNGSFHAFAIGQSSGNTYQDTYTPGSGWGTWQNLGGVLQGGFNVAYVAPNLGETIADIATGQLGYTDSPSDTYCNKFSYFWGAGTTSGCASGTRSEEWCADFAAWAWQQADVSFTYGFGSGDINAGAVSFYQWGKAHGTWHAAGSGYTPQPGDAVVYGLNSGGTSAAHVAIVTGYTAGDAGPNVVNGDFNYKVEAGTDQTTNGDGAALSGYTSP
jgi:CHAP domain